MSNRQASSITELKTTMFLTPVISTVFKGISLLILKIIGWKICGAKPVDKKCIVIGAPHTSNWDFVLFLLYAFSVGFDAHWMGKHTLFPRPFRRLMVWLGGIPIDRSKANSVVGQMVEYFASVEQLTVLITPEGTRSKVAQWKMGFYYIALQAKLPIYLGFLDAKTKSLGIEERFMPSGDEQADMEYIQRFYQGKRGLNPDNG